MPLVSRRIATDRLGVHVLETSPAVPTAAPQRVLLVHGNVSSSPFWRGTLAALEEALPGVHAVAPDLRGFGGTDPEPVDARRGVRDYSDDLAALLRALGWDDAEGGVHVVGWSLGGGVVMQLLRDHPAVVRSLTLVAPVSPYGFGGTRGEDGQLTEPDGAGSGAGGANPEFVRRLAEGDRTDESPFSPLSVMRAFYVHADAAHAVGALADQESLVESMLSTRTGEDHYPGDLVPSPAWPGFAPGGRGVLNTLAPTHFRIDDLHTVPVEPKPPVLWIRGEDDLIVSDTSMFDLAQLGALGAVPGWPGADVCPPQPMVAQTRHALGLYAAAGGEVTELALPRTGHSPHLERPKEFLTALVGHITASS